MKKTTRNKKSAPKKNPALTAWVFLKDLLARPEVHPKLGGLFLPFGAGLTALMMLQMDRFQWLAALFQLPQPLWGICFIFGTLLMVLGFRSLPARAPAGDLPRWAAYPILAVILAVGAFLRFYRADQAYLAYWDDPTNDVNFLVRVADSHDFLVIYPEGATEPLFTYLGGLIWMVFPALKALFVQRLTGNIFNLAALWILYRLGRDVSGKRYVGLLVAALAAASKPLLLHNLSGQNALTLIFSVSLYLWCQFRLFRKPSLAHFLQWGAALGIGLYTYNAIRPWYLYLALATLGWVLWTRFRDPRFWQWRWKAPKTLRSPRKDRLDPVFARVPGVVAPWAVLGFSLCYFLFLLDHILFLFHGNPLSRFWGMDLRVWGALQVLLGLLFFQAFRTSAPKDRTLFGWALGLLAAGFISHPLALHTEVATRISSISLLPKDLAGWFHPDFYGSFFKQAYSAFQFLFTVGSDRTDMNLFGDPLFDYHAEVLVVVGVAAFLARPTWAKVLLAAAVPVAVIPFVFTVDSHSAKVLGSVGPLLLLAAIGLGQWLGKAFEGKGKIGGVLLTLVLACFWGWEIRGTFTRVFDQWWWAVVNDDLAVGQQIDKALPTHRVYLVPSTAPGQRFFSAYVQAVLHDGDPVYLFGEKNDIGLREGEKPRDVAVMVCGFDTKPIARLKKDFPKAGWEPHWQFYQKKGQETPFLYVVTIAADSIPWKSGKCLRFVKREPGDWTRRVYLTGFGLRGGIISREDFSAGPDSKGADAKLKPFSIDGEWDVPREGTYRFFTKNSNYAKVFVDGKCLLHCTREGEDVPREASIHLDKGIHHVRYFSYLMYGEDLPPVTITDEAAHYQKVLGTP